MKIIDHARQGQFQNRQQTALRVFVMKNHEMHGSKTNFSILLPKDTFYGFSDICIKTMKEGI